MRNQEHVKVNNSLLFMFVVAYVASAQNNTSHFVVKEASFERLCESKKILTVNGLFPGPTIYARTGETFFLDIENKGKDNVTMYCCRRWGRHLGSETNYGWLIQPGTKVRQNITLSHDDEGTLWWYAISIWQSVTVHGALVAYSRPGTTPPYPHADIPIIFGQWWKKDLKEVVRESVTSGGKIMKADAYTINGQPGDFYPCSNNGTFKLKVESGKSYLLRIVNAAVGKTLYFGIAKHKLTVVSMDGRLIT